ncbi:MAG: hypothetical protein ABSE71_00780 [Candidatus Micrarchaeaceae archaeon]|jgi:hypothetical protein|nr:hypothetical protein [Candidatus Micrarchaeota archaeon]HII09545.1 hypothetical protein [Candidatus Micrarchaeota archaeon]
MATTSVKPGGAAPREVRLIDQKVMDGLVRNLNQVITVTHTAMPGAASVTTNQILRYVNGFRYILTESDVFPYVHKTPFTEENGAIIRIAVAGDGRYAVLYSNPNFESAEQEGSYDHIREVLGLGVSTVRMLSFGPEIAEMLEKEDLAAAALMRK